MRTIRWTGLAIGLVALQVGSVAAEEKSPAKPMVTRWAADVDRSSVLPEYPRPQMARPDWLSLNGEWDCAMTTADQKAVPTEFEGSILVPFCIESTLSGVKKPLQPDQALWYHKRFQVPHSWRRNRLLLHFGGVDWHTRVLLNGKLVGEHRGGFDPFTFDLTPHLKPEGVQTLLVRVTDPTDTSWQPRGKQVLKPNGIWYTAVSGIWQTVWLEPVPEQHIEHLKITPDVDNQRVRIEVNAPAGTEVRLRISHENRDVARASGKAGDLIDVGLAEPQLWSPDSPFLYDLGIQLVAEGAVVDEVSSYFGMRKVSLGMHAGHRRILLNDEPLFQYGPLDQGWWPDGLYTAPTDEALRFDIELLKRLNMNMLRKHVKIEPDRLYYHCDRLGILVWQDMPSGDRSIGGSDPDIQRSEASAKNFQREYRAMIDSLYNHPCIVMWVVFNEGWGQWDTKRLAEWTKNYDPTRLVNSASGWTDRGVGDVIDVHAYPGPAMRPPEARRASVLGEFGGLGWPVPDHLWWDKRNWGYRTYHSPEELADHYVRLLRRLRPLIGEGLSAAVYTQTSDVEGEVNGLVTYDRAVFKMEPKAVAALHQQLYEPPPKIKIVVPSSRSSPQPWRYTTTAPGKGWENPGFDDSAWQRGEGMFGTAGTPGVRVGTEWNTGDIWLRRAFTLDSVPGGDLMWQVYHDEDAEVYINGVQAGTFNRWVTSHILEPLTAGARAALVPGRNVIAVHCHQTGGGQGVDVGLCVLLPGDIDERSFEKTQRR